MENYRKIHGSEKLNVSAKSKDYKYEDDTIISRIMNNPEYSNDEERAADIAIFLAAGHDTTAYSISWTLLEITRNQPPELAAYRKKIAEQNLPRDEWKRVDELQYMIKEGMRLQPVLAMGTVRDVGKEITYMHEKEKVVLPKDSIYFINWVRVRGWLGSVADTALVDGNIHDDRAGLHGFQIVSLNQLRRRCAWQ